MLPEESVELDEGLGQVVEDAMCVAENERCAVLRRQVRFVEETQHGLGEGRGLIRAEVVQDLGQKLGFMEESRSSESVEGVGRTSGDVLLGRDSEEVAEGRRDDGEEEDEAQAHGQDHGRHAGDGPIENIRNVIGQGHFHAHAQGLHVLPLGLHRTREPAQEKQKKDGSLDCFPE